MQEKQTTTLPSDRGQPEHDASAVEHLHAEEAVQFGSPSSGASYLAIGLGVAVLSGVVLSLPRLLMTEAIGGVSQPLPDDGTKAHVLAETATSDPGKLTSGQYVRAMQYIDRDSQRSRALRRAASSARADAKDAHRAWQQQVELHEAALAGVENPPQGSVHWHLQQDLQRLRADEPVR